MNQQFLDLARLGQDVPWDMSLLDQDIADYPVDPSVDRLDAKYWH